MSINLGFLLISLLATWKFIDILWWALDKDWKKFFKETFE